MKFLTYFIVQTLKAFRSIFSFNILLCYFYVFILTCFVIHRGVLSVLASD